ncbi:hypothetical protein Bca52824_016267 [Brassica carinata]|uniref:Uncharacterized protein n=1 Tax=Brassica carinata TaxID=52824 RepID=A0A8X7W3C6_BRACI|nr:hypothetical protein Bca52824_016267 [Brassica carinata]
MEEADTKDIDSEAAKSLDDADVVADEETSSVKVPGKGERKVNDEGAETRKKRLSMQMANMERMFTERMWKMENGVSQLRDAIRLSGEGAETTGKKIAVETNDFDFGLSTQDVGDLSQATFVDSFDLSQVKVENPRKSRPFYMCTRHLVNETKNAATATAPDAALVFLCEEDWEKVRKWSTYSTPLSCGNTILDYDIANRLMDPSEWLHNWEIDTAMFLFRERTTLKRWKPHRVTFMTTVFRNMIKRE